MGEEKPKGTHSIRQIVNSSGNSSIIRKDDGLTLGFVEQGVTKDAKLNRGNNSHIAGSA